MTTMPDNQALINWVVERWHAEVANRPMINLYRRSLDDTWRRVLRRLGVDDRARLGPTHDDLRAELSTKEWSALKESEASEAAVFIEDVRRMREWQKQYAGAAWAREQMEAAEALVDARLAKAEGSAT